MGPQFFRDVEQNSDEWMRLRAGIQTASCFKDVEGTSARKGRTTYMRKLAGEILTGEPMDHFETFAMKRGHEREQEACALYGVMYGVRPEIIGFVRNGKCGASPDRLIGDEGLLEVKDADRHIQIERLLAGVVPKEYMAQVQGQIMVCDKEWCDFMSHCRGLPPLVIRVYRDERYIAGLRLDINKFDEELYELVDKIKAME